MKPLLLLVHGWGFDASFWDGLRACFTPEDTLAWDLGFFGQPAQPAPPPGRKVLAVGHSLGLLWLLHQRPLGWDGLAGINGFTRFAKAGDFPAGISPRVLERMLSRLATAPAEVVSEFRARQGCTAPLPGMPNAEALAAGLQALAGWDARPALVDAALCGQQDMLVSAAMSKDCFPEDRIIWHEGGHLLPLDAPDWCASQLYGLLERL
ncbi:alpha/beta fold hydrolase [Acidocella aromatica]|uniref:Pimeloyl-ACP methyl ester carboxylesterase n=1 Tax=Acidocella aromatica TaxID=1303579 RepID=A0A840VKF2_9PROT|nr:alpha/beta hydrolase [Acidocella aromatica]MBB5371980.1 pimeloyl-ACP methyl ester carboxylesterase [Acidocella aromatica]